MNSMIEQTPRRLLPPVTAGSDCGKRSAIAGGSNERPRDLRRRWFEIPIFCAIDLLVAELTTNHLMRSLGVGAVCTVRGVCSLPGVISTNSDHSFMSQVPALRSAP